MNLLLLDPEELDGEGRVAIAGRRAAHLLNVLQVTPGAHVRAGVVRGSLGTATVLAAADGRVELRVEIDGPPEPEPNLDLVLALPRPKVLSRVLQTVAAWGVRRVDLVNAWRVERAYFSSPRLATAALAQDVRLGCEQGGGTWLPDVVVHPRLVPFLAEHLGPRLAAHEPSHRLLAHPRVGRYLEDVVGTNALSRVVVAVGPEGGFVERELASFGELGFLSFSLGPRVLRVEAAASAIFAELALLGRRRC
jgi:16S rRNA (uracil1498-N3)-methyltransferase